MYRLQQMGIDLFDIAAGDTDDVGDREILIFLNIEIPN